MPPKKQEKGKAPAPGKVAVDKTFGMKNKKGAQAQKQIALIQQQASQAKTPEQKRKEAEKLQREKDKKAAEDAARETAELFKPIQVQKVPFGVDPKTVVCQYFKAGFCEKGKKCKFAHDLSVERKSAKRDLYQDSREEEKDEKMKDDMADWDEEKLRQVVMSKHGNPKTTTEKVCKYFISAVEEGKYGWFWTCPNGGDKCMYRHSLPPGFVLKTKEQRAAEKAAMDKSPLKTLTLEDFIENERHKLKGPFTPVTEESFQKWKRERIDKKVAEEQAQKAKEATGRAMFEAGGWGSDDEEEEDEDEDEDVGATNGAEWDFERLRLETEGERAKREEQRLAGEGADDAEDIEGGDDEGNGGGGESSARVNGVAGEGAAAAPES